MDSSTMTVASNSRPTISVARVISAIVNIGWVCPQSKFVVIGKEFRGPTISSTSSSNVIVAPAGSKRSGLPTNQTENHVEHADPFQLPERPFLGAKSAVPVLDDQDSATEVRKVRGSCGGQ